MVGVIEGVLIVGALGLDVYAYTKMKEAENAADSATRDRERARFKTHVTETTTITTATPAAAGATASETREEQPSHPADWKPVTYEGYAEPVAHGEDVKDELRFMRDEMKTEYKKIHDRLDVIDERLHEEDSKISVMETKFTHLDSEVEKVRHGSENMEIELPEEQIDAIVEKKLSTKNERLNKKVKDQEKQLTQLQTKLDNALIAAPDAVSIKKDLRSEFVPLLSEPKKLVEDYRTKSDKKIKELDEKIASQKDATLQEVSVHVKKLGSSARDAKRIKDQGKKLAEVEAKLDSHLIAAPDAVLIKKDLREEFYPVLKEPKAALEEHQKETAQRLKDVNKRITEAKETALEETKTRVSKGEFERSISALRPGLKRKATIKAKTASKPKKAAKAKTVKKVKPAKTVASKTRKASKPSKKAAAKKPAKSVKKTPSKRTAKSAKGEVTVTTTVPRGVDVSTEVVSAKSKS
ncbi:hypothetical protein HY572_02290 [Candidatus Micrarchaeota archaeon]|nr:hypothetical protein [Candidatus Micrarchaeota archaeon]